MEELCKLKNQASRTQFFMNATTQILDPEITLIFS